MSVAPDFQTVVRMAFATAQTYDSVLLRGLNIRTPTNAFISSTYTLYTNGNGQTYWSNSVNPTHLSSLSTALSHEATRLSTNTRGVVDTLYSTSAGLSSRLLFQSSQISTIQMGALSTTRRLLINDQQLSNSYENILNQFNLLVGSNAVRIDNIFNSTLRVVNSTLFGYSSFSTFYADISRVQSSVNASASSLSTTFGIANVSSYSTLTLNYTNLIDTALISTLEETGDYISTLSTGLMNSLNEFDLFITTQLLSTSAGLYSTISTNTDALYNLISTVYMSSIVSAQSTIDGHETRVQYLEFLSTGLSSISHNWISSFVSTSLYESQSTQNSTLYAAIGQTNAHVSTLSSFTTTVFFKEFSTFASTATSQINENLSTNRSVYSTLQYLINDFSTLTTSSILAGTYETFMQLENYTSSLIGSTIATTNDFKAGLFLSTSLENQSISNAYFDEYVSTLYASTLSTLIPSTIAMTSTMMSTLYSTSYFYLFSSLMSTSDAVAIDFMSTTSSITRSLVLSTGTQLQSSILSYLSTPAGEMLSTYSSLNALAFSTFSTVGSHLLADQSTLFYTTSVINQIMFDELFLSTVNVFSTAVDALSTAVFMGGEYLSTYSTITGEQFSTHNYFYESTVTTYDRLISEVLNSTTTAVYRDTTSSATSTLYSIERSTSYKYNDYVAGLNAAISTAAYSSIYTEQRINLHDDQFVGVMDLATYRNFTVNVYNVRNNQSNYWIKYDTAGIWGLDFRRGIITINVSTTGQTYTNNYGKLRFDVYRWGIPTTVWGNICPVIENSDYTLQYEYTIHNKIVYTNLLSVFPRLGVSDLNVSSIVKNVFDENRFVWRDDVFWRGTPIQINWSNYSFFPTTQPGAAPFVPEIGVSVHLGGTQVAEYGPYPFTLSTATIYAPYIYDALDPIQTTTVRMWVIGQPEQYVETNFTTLVPAWNKLRLYPPSYFYGGSLATDFMGGNEIVALTDDGTYPLYNLGTLVNTSSEANYNQFYNGNTTYAPDNIINGLLNRAGVSGTTKTSLKYNKPIVELGSAPNHFFEEPLPTPVFVVTLSNDYMKDMYILQQFGSRITATFTNADNPSVSYTFEVTQLTYQGKNWKLANPSITNRPLDKNRFTTGQTVHFTYTYTPVQYISSFSRTLTSDSGPYLAKHDELRFIGGNSKTNPNLYDSATFLDIPNVPSSKPFSTLMFYNLLNNSANPIAANRTANSRVVGYMQYGNLKFYSTFTTTGIESIEQFRV